MFLTDLSIMIASHCTDCFRIATDRQKDIQEEGWKDKQTLNTSEISDRFVDKSQWCRQSDKKTVFQRRTFLFYSFKEQFTLKK